MNWRISSEQLWKLNLECNCQMHLWSNLHCEANWQMLLWSNYQFVLSDVAITSNSIDFSKVGKKLLQYQNYCLFIICCEKPSFLTSLNFELWKLQYKSGRNLLDSFYIRTISWIAAFTFIKVWWQSSELDTNTHFLPRKPLQLAIFEITDAKNVIISKNLIHDTLKLAYMYANPEVCKHSGRSQFWRKGFFNLRYNRKVSLC